MAFDAYHNCIDMPTSKKYNFISLIYNTKTLSDYRASMLPEGFWLVDRRALWKSVLSSAGLRSRRISSDSSSDSDSGLKISTPTPAPTPLRLWPNNSYSTLKGAIRYSHSLHFNFDCIKKSVTTIQHPCALTDGRGKWGMTGMVGKTGTSPVA